MISALIDEPRTTDFDKTKTAAGLKSNKFLKSSEPPLQRKSKSGTAHDRTSKKIQNTNRRQNFETNKDSVENNNNLTKVGVAKLFNPIDKGMIKFYIYGDSVANKKSSLYPANIELYFFLLSCFLTFLLRKTGHWNIKQV